MSPKTSDNKSTPTVEFTLPRGSILPMLLPSPLLPYIEITRMHIPPLHIVCIYPFVIGIALASVVDPIPPTPFRILTSIAKAYPIGLLSGAAGHVDDDVVDYSIDAKYPRCRNRVLVRGAMEWGSALIYALCLLFAKLLLIWRMYGTDYVAFGVFWVVLVWVYPASKRWWNFPQVVLLVLHASPIVWMVQAHIGSGGGRAEDGFTWVGLVMAAAFGTNTMIFDIGYGLLDTEEDLRNRVGSMAVAFQGKIKVVLCALAVVHLMLLVAAGSFAGLGWFYYLCCGAKVGMLVYLIGELDVNSAESAIAFFTTLAAFGGGLMIVSLFGDHTVRYLL